MHSRRAAFLAAAFLASGCAGRVPSSTDPVADAQSAASAFEVSDCEGEAGRTGAADRLRAQFEEEAADMPLAQADAIRENLATIPEDWASGYLWQLCVEEQGGRCLQSPDGRPTEECTIGVGSGLTARVINPFALAG